MKPPIDHRIRNQRSSPPAWLPIGIIVALVAIVGTIIYIIT